MIWKKRVAKEWLWLICTVGGVLLVSVIGSIVLNPHVTGMQFREVIIALTGLVYFIRLTLWAIREIKKEKNADKDKTGFL